MKKYTSLLCLILLVWAGHLKGQSMVTTQPRGSQFAMVGQRIGLTDITVSYHRPAVKGRELWGKLVPYNNGLPMPWRAGANENTTIEFSTDVQVQGQPLKAGTYGLHMIASEEKVIVIFTHNATAWGSYAYDIKEDALRIESKLEKAAVETEYLEYSFPEVAEAQTTCVLRWGNKQIPFTISADVNNLTLASLRKDLQSKAGWTWLGFYEAAQFCQANNINHTEALAWINRSIAMNPQFINVQVKANLLAQQNALPEAEKPAYVSAQIAAEFEKQPVDWKAWHQAANFALNRKVNLNAALGWAEKSVSMHANFTNLMTQAELLTATGNAKKASKIQEKAFSVATNQQLNQRGYQLLFAGKAEEAVAMFKVNTEKNPDDPNVWDSLAEGYLRTGQKEKAVESLKKCLSMNPSDMVKNHALGLLQEMGEKYEG